MSVKATFNNEEYELIYNEQSGFYEIEIEAPKQGGVYNAEITFKDLIENTETSTKKIRIWAKEKMYYNQARKREARKSTRRVWNLFTELEAQQEGFQKLSFC